jgi:hypothetical protein
MIASKIMFTAIKPMNINKFLLASRRSRVAAPAKIIAILTNSEGWTDIPPIKIQRTAPNALVPKINVAASMMGPSIEIGLRSSLVLSRSRKNNPIAKNRHIPSDMKITCLISSVGALVATTERPIVDKKNPMVSTSKAILRIALVIK